MKSGRAAREGLKPEQFELIAKALADPRRVALLEAIANERCCGCSSLRRQFPVSKATISHHIKELVRAGLVTAQRQGQYLQCQVRREVLEAYTSALLQRVGPEGIVITKRGKPVAKLIPIGAESSELIGALRGRLKVKGRILSTGLSWDAKP